MQASLTMKIVNVVSMFQAIEERRKFIEEQDLHMNANGDILDDEGNMYNPWFFQYQHGDSWISVVGICTYHGEALKRLYQLKQNNPDTRFRMSRANDLECFTVYTE